MAVVTNSNRRESAWIETEHTEQAVIRFHEYLRNHPDDAKAWNDAGTVLCRLGRNHDALACLERARDLSEEEEIGRNLIRVSLEAGHIIRAREFMRELHQAGNLEPVWIQELADSWLDRGNPSVAMEAVLTAQELFPDCHELQNVADRIRSVRARIAFFCGGDGPTFLRNILDYTRQRYPVREFEGTTVPQVRQLMDWSDIAWFEWCTDLAEIGSRFSRVSRNIIRLHRYEAYLDWPRRVNWDTVDTLITVGNRYVHEALFAQVPDLAQRTRIETIPNGVDVDRIRFHRRRAGKKLAFVGNYRLVKNPMLLLQCMAELHRRNPSYHLYIAGKVQDTSLEQYVRHMVRTLELDSVIHFDGWQEDIQTWLADKNFIVCTSVIESQGMGILEAMAGGIRPVVHHFPGARETFGSEWLFTTPHEFCDQILSPEYQSSRYRAFVESRYSLSEQLQRIGQVLLEMENGLPSLKTTLSPVS